MRTMTRLVALTFVLLAPAAMARAEVVNCTNIATLPFTVTSPGIYCFNASLAYPAASGIAINIASDDVVLDLNGHVLDGSAAGPATTTYGILALDRTNVTVRNGAVRGFYIGVQLAGRSPQNNLAEDLRVDRSTTYGLVLRGLGSVARHNIVTRTGGVANGLAIGIYGAGDGVHVVDNEVVGTVEGPGGQAMGIRVDSGVGAVVERNVVSNASFGPTDSYGIRLSQSSPQATIATNRIVNFRNGIFFTFGGSGVYRDNTVGGALVPFDSVWRAGANDATHLFTTRVLTFGETVVPPGSYTLWIQHTRNGTFLIVNRQTGQWGTVYDPAQDLGRVPMQMAATPSHVEEMTVTVRSLGGNRGAIDFSWGPSVATASFTATVPPAR